MTTVQFTMGFSWLCLTDRAPWAFLTSCRLLLSSAPDCLSKRSPRSTKLSAHIFSSVSCFIVRSNSIRSPYIPPNCSSSRILSFNCENISQPGPVDMECVAWCGGSWLTLIPGVGSSTTVSASHHVSWCRGSGFGLLRVACIVGWLGAGLFCCRGLSRVGML